MLELFSSPEAWISLTTLAALEIVLGIDNVVFISILAGRLPEDKRPLTMRLGLAGALVMRLVLLAGINWVMGLSKVLFTVWEHPVTGKDMILVAGGLFLMGKAVVEIYDKVEAAEPVAHHEAMKATAGNMASVIAQVMLLDLVFSLDSVITAVGMVDELVIMVIAVVMAIVVMMVFAVPIADFVERRPSVKILALAFLVMIGALLVAEGTGAHLDKAYVYFAMGFSLAVEMLNVRYRTRRRQLEKARSPLGKEQEMESSD